jgi:aspartate aminotransferase-like enzyme
MSGFGKFFLPGPTEVKPEILATLTRPMISHRGSEIEAIMTRIDERLQKVFRTTEPVFTVTSSATGLMEGGVRNTVQKRVLCLINGAFSKRFHKAALNSGIPCDKLEVEFGSAHTPEMLADALKKNTYDVVTVVHSETSTGVLNPIKDLTKVAHDAGDIVMVIDTVSSMAAAPIECGAWDLDYVLTGSQKAFALPPGLAFCTANKRILDRAQASKMRGIYFDLVEIHSSWQKHQSPNTPGVSLLYALDAQLESMMKEGIETRWARHAEMAKRTWSWVDEQAAKGRGIKVLAPEGYRSPAVTCISAPAGRTGPQIVSAMKARGFVITPGYGDAKDSMIRIGHMGEHTLAELDVLLGELDEVLAS